MDNMRKKKGQALVEVAIALPIIILLLCAMIDFARILYVSQTLNLVNQEAVRRAGIGRSYEEVEDYVMDNCHLADMKREDVDTTPRDPKSGNYATVNLRYEVKYITPFLNEIFDPFTVNTSSTIRVE
jgi:Flp pilus assembly protein TadG